MEVFDTIAFSCGLIIASSCFCTAIAQGLIAREGIEAVYSEPKAFGKYITLEMIPHTVAIYGLLLTILLFNFGGIITPEFSSVDASNIDFVEEIGIFYSVLAIPTILSGYLPLKVEGDINESSIFCRKILFSVAGHATSLIGLMISIMLMLNGGIL